MRGTITKIHNLKRSRNGNLFIRITFKLENGDWAKTDICPDYRNYIRWAPLLKVGTDLSGLILKRQNEVNADSFPVKISSINEGKWVQKEDGTMQFIKIKPPVIEVDKDIDSTYGMEQKKLL